jgi:hypothetical protein
MCQYSATAENMRDATRGEDLVVTPAPHGSGNWLTAPNNPDCAVCVPHSAILGVRLPGCKRRRASFRQLPGEHMFEDKDFLRFVDGDREMIALNDLPRGTAAHVDMLFYNGLDELKPYPQESEECPSLTLEYEVPVMAER